MTTDWRVDEPARVAVLAAARLPPDLPAALPLDPVVQRVPILFGSRLTVVDVPDDAVVLRPPPPGEPVADVRAAVRDALRFPLAGEPLEALVTPRRARDDRRRAAVAPAPGRAERPAAGGARGRVGGARAGRRPDRATDAARRDRPDAPAAAARPRDGSASSPPASPGASAAPSRSTTPRSPELVELEPSGQTPLAVHPALRRHRPGA